VIFLRSFVLRGIPALIVLLALAAPVRAGLRGLREGGKLAPVSLAGLGGEALPLPDPRALTVAVFWSTWSPRSEPLLALWQELAAAYSTTAHPLRVIAVNADHQEMEGERTAAVRAWLAEKKIALPAALDPGLALFDRLGVIALPTTLFFRADGTLVREYPGFPSSAALDLREELEKELGIVRAEPYVPTGEVRARGRLAFQPANNALLYLGMGNALRKAGMKEKARLRWAEALRRDGDYPDPLRALEEDFFAGGRDAAKDKALHDFLAGENLPALADRYGK
jgi:hypothetical protein